MRNHSYLVARDLWNVLSMQALSGGELLFKGRQVAYERPFSQCVIIVLFKSNQIKYFFNIGTKLMTCYRRVHVARRLVYCHHKLSVMQS